MLQRFLGLRTIARTSIPFSRTSILLAYHTTTLMVRKPVNNRDQHDIASNQMENSEQPGDAMIEQNNLQTICMVHFHTDYRYYHTPRI